MSERAATVNKKAKATADQEHTRELFAEASLYAQGAITDPALKLEYQKKAAPGGTAFNRAIQDYFRSPEVKAIDESAYDGSIGSVISVKARDDFKVAYVSVRVRDAFGAVIEEGFAILRPRNLNIWDYTATAGNASLTGCTIMATAYDLPGNKASLEVIL